MSDDEPYQGGSPDPGSESDSSLFGLDSGLDDELAPARGCLTGILISVPFDAAIIYVIWRWISGS